MEGELLRIEDIMNYYESSMPYSDREDVPRGVLTAYAQHSLFLWENVAWCRQLPVDIFLENVAAYRVNSERIEDCRHWFYEMVMPLLCGLSWEEAVLEVNLWCCANAAYHQADERTANAVTVYKSGYGRCGEESTFAVTVLRSVGIAARQVYAPLWSHCDDNHAWVEVWWDGKWQYFGACEPEPVLNRGWFDLPASKAMLVHARTFGAALGQQEVIGRTGGVTYYNATAHYAETAEVVFCCVDEADRPLAGAVVKLEILNYAHFGTIAMLAADEEGRIRARLGLGSLHLSCFRDSAALCALVRIEKSGELPVKFKAPPQDLWMENRFYAPAYRRPCLPSCANKYETKTDFETALHTLPGSACKRHAGKGKEMDPESVMEFQKKIEAAKARRQQRILGYYDPVRGGRFPEAEGILRMAGGNFEEVIRFLEMDDNPCRLKLLKALAQKDYYDCRADILQEHLDCALSFAGQEGMEEDVFVNYVLNPRIEYEELSCWRRALAQELAGSAVRYREEPRLIWEEICSRLNLLTALPVKDSVCDTLRMNPLSTYKSGRGSLVDQKILFVAIARSLGIPARLNPETGEPEFYQRDEFYPANPEIEAEGSYQTAYRLNSAGKAGSGQKAKAQKGGRLHFLAGGEKSWVYWTDWCLEYLKEDGYHALDLRERKWEDGQFSLAVRQGCYRVTTVVRLPDGDQLEKEFCFRKGEEDRMIRLERHRVDWEMQAKGLLQIKVRTQNGSADLNSLRKGKKAAYIWLREGEEPTEHILNELLERISDVKNHQDSIFLLCREPAKPSGILEKLLQAAGNIGFYQVDSFDAAERIAETMGVVGQLKYPLAVAVDEAGRDPLPQCNHTSQTKKNMIKYILTQKLKGIGR